MGDARTALLDVGFSIEAECTALCLHHSRPLVYLANGAQVYEYSLATGRRVALPCPAPARVLQIVSAAPELVYTLVETGDVHVIDALTGQVVGGVSGVFASTHLRRRAFSFARILPHPRPTPGDHLGLFLCAPQGGESLRVFTISRSAEEGTGVAEREGVSTCHKYKIPTESPIVAASVSDSYGTSGSVVVVTRDGCISVYKSGGSDTKHSPLDMGVPLRLKGVTVASHVSSTPLGDALVLLGTDSGVLVPLTLTLSPPSAALHSPVRVGVQNAASLPSAVVNIDAQPMANSGSNSCLIGLSCGQVYQYSHGGPAPSLVNSLPPTSLGGHPHLTLTLGGCVAGASLGCRLTDGLLPVPPGLSLPPPSPGLVPTTPQLPSSVLRVALPAAESGLPMEGDSVCQLRADRNSAPTIHPLCPSVPPPLETESTNTVAECLATVLPVGDALLCCWHPTHGALYLSLHTHRSIDALKALPLGVDKSGAPSEAWAIGGGGLGVASAIVATTDSVTLLERQGTSLLQRKSRDVGGIGTISGHTLAAVGGDKGACVVVEGGIAVVPFAPALQIRTLTLPQTPSAITSYQWQEGEKEREREQGRMVCDRVCCLCGDRLVLIDILDADMAPVVVLCVSLAAAQPSPSHPSPPLAPYPRSVSFLSHGVVLVSTQASLLTVSESGSVSAVCPLPHLGACLTATPHCTLLPPLASAAPISPSSLVSLAACVSADSDPLSAARHASTLPSQPYAALGMSHLLRSVNTTLGTEDWPTLVAALKAVRVSLSMANDPLFPLAAAGTSDRRGTACLGVWQGLGQHYDALRGMSLVAEGQEEAGARQFKRTSHVELREMAREAAGGRKITTLKGFRKEYGEHTLGLDDLAERILDGAEAGDALPQLDRRHAMDAVPAPCVSVLLGGGVGVYGWDSMFTPYTRLPDVVSPKVATPSISVPKRDTFPLSPKAGPVPKTSAQGTSVAEVVPVETAPSPVKVPPTPEAVAPEAAPEPVAEAGAAEGVSAQEAARQAWGQESDDDWSDWDDEENEATASAKARLKGLTIREPKKVSSFSLSQYQGAFGALPGSSSSLSLSSSVAVSPFVGQKGSASTAGRAVRGDASPTSGDLSHSVPSVTPVMEPGKEAGDTEAESGAARQAMATAQSPSYSSRDISSDVSSGSGGASKVVNSTSVPVRVGVSEPTPAISAEAKTTTTTVAPVASPSEPSVSTPSVSVATPSPSVPPPAPSLSAVLQRGSALLWSGKAVESRRVLASLGTPLLNRQGPVTPALKTMLKRYRLVRNVAELLAMSTLVHKPQAKLVCAMLACRTDPEADIRTRAEAYLFTGALYERLGNCQQARKIVHNLHNVVDKLSERQQKEWHRMNTSERPDTKKEMYPLTKFPCWACRDGYTNVVQGRCNKCKAGLRFCVRGKRPVTRDHGLCAVCGAAESGHNHDTCIYCGNTEFISVPCKE
ncbi:hypothetical protein KIPB_001194 [Kipferlia bialata]|uniref:Uncharacterized protein n=1 Tax=Kipferlia bialata TaxID=797122 RepID=A0A9K3GFE5_9EUKA|nr:hypothetical protein KIPB_001194 [Kipferlia bialata]|eukprot:g1194.t1